MREGLVQERWRGPAVDGWWSWSSGTVDRRDTAHTKNRAKDGRVGCCLSLASPLEGGEEISRRTGVGVGCIASGDAATSIWLVKFYQTISGRTVGYIASATRIKTTLVLF